jgi:hypothetical protein
MGRLLTSRWHGGSPLRAISAIHYGWQQSVARARVLYIAIIAAKPSLQDRPSPQAEMRRTRPFSLETYRRGKSSSLLSLRAKSGIGPFLGRVDPP